jgi:hypothetical protein
MQLFWGALPSVNVVVWCATDIQVVVTPTCVRVVHSRKTYSKKDDARVNASHGGSDRSAACYMAAWFAAAAGVVCMVWCTLASVPFW